MSLYVRMLCVLIVALFKPRLPAGVTSCSLSMVVLPNDLDVNLHMNNGRFLTICDLNRVDLFIRTGLLTVMRRRRWTPIVAEHTMIYRKPLRLFDRYIVSLELVGWDEKYFNMRHSFFRRGTLIAEGTSKGCVRSRDGVIPPLEVIAAIRELRQS